MDDTFRHFIMILKSKYYYNFSNYDITKLIKMKNTQQNKQACIAIKCTLLLFQKIKSVLT